MHIGTGLQKTVKWESTHSVKCAKERYLLERHIEQIKPTSMIFLWQKHVARKSTLSSVGTAIKRRKPGGGRKAVYIIVSGGPSGCSANDLRRGTEREPDEF